MQAKLLATAVRPGVLLRGVLIVNCPVACFTQGIREAGGSDMSYKVKKREIFV